MPMVVALLLLQAGLQGLPAPLQVPVRCQPGRDCFVQKHVDQQVGPGRRDYRCGVLTTEEHDGVDLRLRTIADLQRGVDVVAAAPGTVLRVRDGETDVSVRDRAGSAERMAGNGVVVSHGNGWETQYSHLRNGSIAVRAGERVAAGQKLGLVGLSGNTEYPHLHFTVRRNGQAYDPFTARPRGSACASSAGAFGNGLWSPAAGRALAYQPTAVLAVGFSSGPADPAAARAGRYDRIVVGKQDPMVLWADSFGTADGDVQIFTLTAPGGARLMRTEVPVARGALSWFGFSGKRPGASGWAPGRYRGSYELLRRGALVAKGEASVEVR
jgi:hypothetical protein